MVRVKAHCTVCDFKTEYDLDINEYGFFEVPPGYCPNDFTVLDQIIGGHMKSITDEVENEPKRRS